MCCLIWPSVSALDFFFIPKKNTKHGTSSLHSVFSPDCPLGRPLRLSDCTSLSWLHTAHHPHSSTPIKMYFIICLHYESEQSTNTVLMAASVKFSCKFDNSFLPNRPFLSCNKWSHNKVCEHLKFCWKKKLSTTAQSGKVWLCALFCLCLN